MVSRLAHTPTYAEHWEVNGGEEEVPPKSLHIVETVRLLLTLKCRVKTLNTGIKEKV
jgi:hypothetical protein